MKYISNKTKQKYTMKRLKGRIIKRDFVGFDVETVGETNDFYIGGLYWYNKNGSSEYKFFYDKEEMIQFLLSKRFKKHWIVATNLDFDLTALFWNTEHWNSLQLVTRAGKIVLAKHKLKGKNNGTINFIDTFNYARFSVANLGLIIGEEKSAKPECLGRLPKNTWENIELLDYNRQDCKITCDFMYFFQKGVNEAGGNLRITIASTALDTWRRRFLKQDLIQESMFYPEFKKDCFNGYYGGRTETFKRGKIEGYNYYDINSLYPSQMLQKYPLPNSVKRSDIPTLDIIKNYEGFSEVLVTSPDSEYPFLPYRKDKLIFPNGTFFGTYNHNELRKALSLGYKITKVIKQYYYTETFYPFKEFVEFMYEKRLKEKQKGSSYELVYKLLMNSLSGKFAQRQNEKVRILDKDHLTIEQRDNLLDDTTQDDVYINEESGKIIIRETFESKGVFVFPILSSYTTSYGRITMYDYIKDYQAVYTDTDSIICKKVMEESNKLGEMKLEKHIGSGYIIKPKMYMIDEEIKIKGFTRAGKTEFLRFLSGESCEYQKFSKLRESVRRNMIPNTKMSVRKRLSLEDTKRYWKGKQFNKEQLQDSEPLVLAITGDILNNNEIVTDKQIRTKSMYEDILANTEHDLLDLLSKGKDISNEEFLKNEMEMQLER